MKMRTDDSVFMKDMQNIIDYSIGFLDGVQRGKNRFFENLGKKTIDSVKNYVDTMAKVDDQLLQHVYEWGMSGSPDARLFDLDYSIRNNGLSIGSTFKQSTSVKAGSNVPFYDKARIMEEGIPVTIRPKTAKTLVFDVNGETVFSKGPVNVVNPGGMAAQGGLQKTLDRFFDVYFSQAFLYSSGISDYLKKPSLYKKNINAGKRGGRATGISTGYRWIANAGAEA
jgi:hypothetical protein